MRFGVASRRPRGVTVEITPMVDVVFLLIIFFMATAQVAQMTRADVDLPQEKGEQQAVADEAGLVINLTADGRIIVAERTVQLAELESIVRKEIRRDPDRPPDLVKLLLRADRNAPAGRLNRIVDLLESLGVGQARLATEVPR